MKLVKLNLSSFKNCESTVTPKVLINICDYLIYGLTDTNLFYRNLYVKPQQDYNANDHRLGDLIISEILSYHFVANLVCVELPKTTYNMIPFKLNHFRTCCKKLSEFITNRGIKEIHTPIFGTKILEGNWNEILNVMNETLSNTTLETICIYEQLSKKSAS